MRAFGQKEKKQKSLRLNFNQLIQRLNLLEVQKQKYLDSLQEPKQEILKIEQKKDEEQNLKEEKLIIPTNYLIIEINRKKYDLSKFNNAEIIITKIKQLQQQKIDKCAHIVELRPLSAIEFYLLVNQANISDNLHFIKEDICTICQFELFEIKNWNDLDEISSNSEIVVGLPCDHYYHQECLNNCINEQHVQCPVCSKIYGVKTGDQPNGKMTYYIDYNSHCEGYENVGTIVIQYEMYGGQRNGANFPPTYRDAFLPDTSQGRQVFRLLKLAFERKLIFTVGRSVTTGKDNRIVWNGIHHKTCLYGGISCFGYPDATYFNRVKEELAAKGIY